MSDGRHPSELIPLTLIYEYYYFEALWKDMKKMRNPYTSSVPQGYLFGEKCKRCFNNIPTNTRLIGGLKN